MSLAVVERATEAGRERAREEARRVLSPDEGPFAIGFDFARWTNPYIGHDVYARAWRRGYDGEVVRLAGRMGGLYAPPNELPRVARLRAALDFDLGIRRRNA